MAEKLVRLKREVVKRGSVLEFCEDEVRLPDGRTETWDFVHHIRGGGACVVPVLPDGRILMVRQSRPCVGLDMLELPAGARDRSDESPAVTALRELREETGYTAGHFEHLATVMSAPAYCDETTDIFLATELEYAGDQILDEAEDIRTEVYELSELLQMIRSGEITDSKTVTGILACAAEKH